MCQDDVIVKEFEFLSSNQYYMIHGKMWIPRQDVLAIVQIAHGMSEYIERYEEFARYLAMRNILVVGNDHMGHGQSVNQKEDLGYFAIPFNGLKGKEKKKFEASSLVVKDMRHITRIIKKHYPGVPYIMMGHSMGSFFTRRYMMEYGKELDGAILMGTGNSPAAEVRLAKILCEIISLCKGDRHRSKLMARLMFGSYNKKYDSSEGEFAWLTTDAQKRQEYEGDEKSGYLFTMNGLRALFSTILFVEKDQNISRIPKEIKTLLVSGEDDPVGGYTRQVQQVYESLQKKGLEDVSVKFYEQCRHELLNETIREQVYQDICQWIEEHVIHPPLKN